MYKSSVFITKLVRPKERRKIKISYTYRNALSGESYNSFRKEYRDMPIDNAPLIPDIPSDIYGYNITRLNEDITYNLNNKDLEGKEVICKVDVMSDDMKVLVNDSRYIGDKPSQVRNSDRYKKHFNIKKKESRKYKIIENGIEKDKLYDADDAEEVDMFVEWDNVEKTLEEGKRGRKKDKKISERKLGG